MTLSQAAIDRAAEVLCDMLRDYADDLERERIEREERGCST